MLPRSAMTLFLLLGSLALAQEPPNRFPAQKKLADENWALLELGPAAAIETPHLYIQGPKSMEKRLKDVANLLEKHYEVARKILALESAEPVAGKVAVYLIPERTGFTTLVRRLEKRRVESEESGSHFAEGEAPHVLAGPPRGKADPTLEGQAGEQIAQLLLTLKASPKTPLPGWFVAGFGRATSARVAPQSRSSMEERKRVATQVARGRAARDLWSTGLEADEGMILQGSFVNYLAYELGMKKFQAILEGFKPGENEESRTFDQALESAMTSYEAINGGWRNWAVRQR